MVGYELRVSFLIKFMVIVSTVNLSKFFMLRTNFALLGSQPGIAFYGNGEEDDDDDEDDDGDGDEGGAGDESLGLG